MPSGNFLQLRQSLLLSTYYLLRVEHVEGMAELGIRMLPYVDLQTWEWSHLYDAGAISYF
jgi:hypothetical protein